MHFESRDYTVNIVIHVQNIAKLVCYFFAGCSLYAAGGDMSSAKAAALKDAVQIIEAGEIHF